jgi:hypothetical protein
MWKNGTKGMKGERDLYGRRQIRKDGRRERQRNKEGEGGREREKKKEKRAREI